MGMIGTSGAVPDRSEASKGRCDEAAAGEPQPFSHDSHFSVSLHDAPGYGLHAIGHIVVIAANGHIVAVEQPGVFRRRWRKGAMPVPVATLSKVEGPVRFLWGPSRSLLSRSEIPRGRRAVGDHLKYKALHQKVLQGVGDIALQAFLRFLERSAESAAAELEEILEHRQCKLAFRFQYDENYLHERHAAQLAWKRFLADNPPKGGGPVI